MNGTALTCANFGGHTWTQVRPGKWPYIGQPCLCGKVKR